MSDAKEVAAEVIRQLGGNVVQAEIPEAIATIVRDRARHGGCYEVHMLSALGSLAPSVFYRFMPSGAIELELRDCNGVGQWTGTLRPRPVTDQ